MSEKEYAVIVNKGVDLNQLESELTSSTGSGPIPSRSVDVVNARKGSKRITHFALTQQEAQTLENDPRIRAVEIPPDQRDDIQIGLKRIQEGNFGYTTASDASKVNWGLRRCMEKTNVFATESNSTYENMPGSFEYAVDGTGVDVVIQDSGVELTHPEWEDSHGGSRFKAIDWYAESGVSGTQNANHYRDYDGHGTHCAGISAGKTYGWAKGADIYAQKVAGLEGTGDSGTGIPVADAFDTIREWHNAKTNGRPTVVNMSWGYAINTSDDPVSGEYRGSVWNYPGTYSNSTALWTATGIVPIVGIVRTLPSRNTFADVEVEDMIDDGIHVCIAAGNDYYKGVLSTSLDYNNYVNFGGGAVYYHRGASPHDDRAFIVGNANTTVDYAVQGVNNQDRTAGSSSRGERVNIWAPGTDIMSTASNFNNTFDYTQYNYPGNSSYKIMQISGTSMASPQVAGVCAQYLRVNPTLTPDQLRTALLNDCDNAMYSSGSNTDYLNYFNSILGASQKFLHSRYSRSPVKFNVKTGIKLR